MTKHLVGITVGMMLLAAATITLLARKPFTPPVAVAPPVVLVGLEKLKWGMTVEEVRKLYPLATSYTSSRAFSEHFFSYQWRGCRNGVSLFFDSQRGLFQVWLNIDHASGKSCQAMAVTAVEKAYGVGLKGEDLDPPRGTTMPDCTHQRESQFHSKLSVARCWKNTNTVARLYDRTVTNLIFAKRGVTDPEVHIVPELPM